MPKTKKGCWTQIGMVTMLTSLCLGAMYGLRDVPIQTLTKTMYDIRFQRTIEVLGKEVEKAESDEFVEHRFASLRAGIENPFLVNCILVGLIGVVGFGLVGCIPKTDER